MSKKKGMGHLVPPEDTATDMNDLTQLLDKLKIPYILKVHPVTALEPSVKDLIGFYPAGEWQVIINDTYSVIRGVVTFGYYELYNISERRKGFAVDIERYASPKELIEDLLSHDRRLALKVVGWK